MPDKKKKEKYPDLDYAKYNKDNYKKGEVKPTQIGGYNPPVTREEVIIVLERDAATRRAGF